MVCSSYNIKKITQLNGKFYVFEELDNLFKGFAVVDVVEFFKYGTSSKLTPIYGRIEASIASNAVGGKDF